MQQEQNMREVIVISTRGEDPIRIQTAVTKWKDLADLISSSGNYDMSNLKAVESVGKTTLEHPGASLPEGDFRVFLRPVKVKSGIDFSTLSFKEVQEAIKADPEAKAYLNEKAKTIGKNWTQLTLDQRREFLEEFYDGEKEYLETIDSPENTLDYLEADLDSSNINLEESELNIKKSAKKFRKVYKKLNRTIKNIGEISKDNVENAAGVFKLITANLIDANSFFKCFENTHKAEKQDLIDEMNDIFKEID